MKRVHCKYFTLAFCAKTANFLVSLKIFQDTSTKQLNTLHSFFVLAVATARYSPHKFVLRVLYWPSFWWKQIKSHQVVDISVFLCGHAKYRIFMHIVIRSLWPDWTNDVIRNIRCFKTSSGLLLVLPRIYHSAFLSFFWGLYLVVSNRSSRFYLNIFVCSYAISCV